MRLLRGSGAKINTVRAVALFGFLLQFTLPFGFALALSWEGPPNARFASLCWGASLDPDSPEKPSHGIACPTPGGCCALSGVERVIPPTQADRDAEHILIFPSEGETLSQLTPFFRDLPRGPPLPS